MPMEVNSTKNKFFNTIIDGSKFKYKYVHVLIMSKTTLNMYVISFAHSYLIHFSNFGRKICLQWSIFQQEAKANYIPPDLM